MNDNQTQQLIDEALDALFETWDTCPHVSAIALMTRAHGWEWTPDGQRLRFVAAPEAFTVDPGITFTEVEDMVRKNQLEIAKRHRKLVAAAQGTVSDEGMPLEFEFTRKKKTGPDITKVMQYVGFMQKEYERNARTVDFALQARLDEWERLLVEDYEEWCREMEKEVREPYQKLFPTSSPSLTTFSPSL